MEITQEQQQTDRSICTDTYTGARRKDRRNDASGINATVKRGSVEVIGSSGAQAASRPASKFAPCKTTPSTCTDIGAYPVNTNEREY